MKTFILLVACLFGSSNALSCYKGGFYNGGATAAFLWVSDACTSTELVCVRYESTVTDTESGTASTAQGIIGKCATACPTTCGTSADLVTALKNGETDTTITSVAVDSAVCKIQCCTSDNCNQFGSTATDTTVCPATTSGASSIESGMLFVLFAAIGQMILA